MAHADRWVWAKLDRHFTRAQAMNPACTDWQRVALAAWAEVKPDGIARFGRGELAEAAARADRKTGEMIPLRNPQRAVRDAVANGWLADGSSVRELHVPGGVLKVGMWPAEVVRVPSQT